MNQEDEVDDEEGDEIYCSETLKQVNTVLFNGNEGQEREHFALVLMAESDIKQAIRC